MSPLARWWTLATSRGVALALAVAAPLVTALVVLGVTSEDVTQHNGLATSDASHLRFFVEHRSTAAVDAAKALSDLGAAGLLALFAVVAAGVLWWRGQRLVVAVAPAVTLAAAAVVASIAKHAVGRARPPIAVRLVNETEPSFPSGHATDSTAFYMALALIVAVFVLRRPLARAAAVLGATLLAAAIGLSRLVLGVHWPTDVLAGWSLGTLAALVVTFLTIVAVRLTPPDPASARWVRARLVSVLQRRRTIEVCTSLGTG